MTGIGPVRPRQKSRTGEATGASRRHHKMSTTALDFLSVLWRKETDEERMVRARAQIAKLAAYGSVAPHPSRSAGHVDSGAAKAHTHDGSDIEFSSSLSDGETGPSSVVWSEESLEPISHDFVSRKPSPSSRRSTFKTTILGKMFILTRDPSTGSYGFALMDCPAATGMRVYAVVEGSEADLQGVTTGSVISEVNGVRVLGATYEAVEAAVEAADGDLRVRFMSQEHATKFLAAEGAALEMQRGILDAGGYPCDAAIVISGEADSGCEDYTLPIHFYSSDAQAFDSESGESMSDNESNANSAISPWASDLSASTSSSKPPAPPLEDVKVDGRRCRLTGSKLYPYLVGTYHELNSTYCNRAVYGRSSHHGISYLYYTKRVGGGHWRVSRNIGRQKSKICAFTRIREPHKVQDWYEAVGAVSLNLTQHQPTIRVTAVTDGTSKKTKKKKTKKDREHSRSSLSRCKPSLA